MAAKTAKLAALPAALGFASVRVYALNEVKTEELLSPQELSVYTPLPQRLHYVEEDPGLLQRSLGVVRVGLLPYVRTIKNACVTIKIGAINLYHAGEDTYEFLKDPPPGFLPRVSVITVCGLAGLVLARKGSRLKRIGAPLGLATVGTAVCYPAQTVGVLKLSGKKAYAATQWASSSVTSLWKPSPAPSASPESVPLPTTEPEVPPAKPVPEAESAPPPVDEPVSSPLPEADPASVPGDEAVSVPVPVPEAGVLAVAEEPAPLVASEAPPTAAPTEENVLESASDPASPEPVPAESHGERPPAIILGIDTPAEQSAPPADLHSTPASAVDPAPPTPVEETVPLAPPPVDSVATPIEETAQLAPLLVEEAAPLAPPPVEEAVPLAPPPVEEAAPLAPPPPLPAEEAISLALTPAEESVPLTPLTAEETATQLAAADPASASAPVEEPAVPPNIADPAPASVEPASLPVTTDPTPASAPVEEPALPPIATNPTPTPVEEPASASPAADPTSPEPAAEAVEKPRFAPDPKLMDHGQSSPEDADLYSTRS